MITIVPLSILLLLLAGEVRALRCSLAVGRRSEASFAALRSQKVVPPAMYSTCVEGELGCIEEGREELEEEELEELEEEKLEDLEEGAREELEEGWLEVRVEDSLRGREERSGGREEAEL